MKPDFIIIPHQVYTSDQIHPADVKVYGVVYWYERLKDGVCKASNTSIAEVAGMATGSARNSISRLQKAGFITCEYEDEKKKKRLRIKTNIQYRVSSKVSSGNDTGVIKQLHKVSSDDAQNKNSRKEKKNVLKDIERKRSSKQPSKEVTDLVSYWKTKLDMPSDESSRMSRYHATTLLKRMKKALVEKGGKEEQALVLCQRVVDAAMADPFHGAKSTTMLYIMRNASRIIQEARSKTLKQTIVSI